MGEAPRAPDPTARQPAASLARAAPVPRASVPRGDGARGALAHGHRGVERATEGAVRDRSAEPRRDDRRPQRLDGPGIRSRKHVRGARVGDDGTRRAPAVRVAAQTGPAPAASARRVPQHDGARRAPPLERGPRARGHGARGAVATGTTVRGGSRRGSRRREPGAVRPAVPSIAGAPGAREACSDPPAPLGCAAVNAPPPPPAPPGTIVVALGGNAVAPPGERPTISNQFRHTRASLAPIVD